ncbi:MAG: hypothetical protein COB84_10175 [Rhodobacteraceae bacterium]|nr:MAG: hypothetical protein COB84_10175 [Paracoccaceae bacterium]
MPKAKYVYQDLLDRQIRVTNIVGYAIVAVFGVIFLVSKFIFSIEHPLINITAGFLVASLANLLLYRLHKKIFLTYQFIIIMTFMVILIMSWYSGGLRSPAIFMLTTVPVAAFSTSQKQGVAWSVTVFIAIIVTLLCDSMLPESIIAEQHQLRFSFILLLLVIGIIIMLSYLVNESAFSTHRKLDRDRKQLEDKSIRLENLTTLLNYSNDLMCIIEQDNLMINDLNPVFKLHLGYELSEVRGKHMVDFIKSEEATPDLEKDLKSLQDDQVYEFSCTMLSKSGAETIFHWVAIAKNGIIHASARMNIC